jgi:hypothetical protein
MPSGYRVGKVADDANDDVGFVLTVGTIDGDQAAIRVKVMLDKIAGGKFRPRVFRSSGVSILTIS